MKSVSWRALLLSLCAIVAVLAAIEVYLEYGGPHSTSFVGQWGDTVGASTVPFHLVVLSIDPGHGADRAGLRPGDLIDIRKNTAVERFWLFGQPPTGRSITVEAARNGAHHRFTVFTETITPLRLFMLTPVWLGYVWIALFAAIIAWRRSDNPQMRSLCLLLIVYSFWQTTDQHYVSSDDAWMLAAFATINSFGALAVALWAACAASFGGRQSFVRKAAQRLCLALVGIAIAISLTRIVAILTLKVDPVAVSSIAAGLPYGLALLAGAVCMFLAIAAAEEAERQRAVWSLLPVGVLLSIAFVAQSLQGVVKSYDLAWSVYIAAAALNVLTPMVLTYVALNRRLLDIGFVLNRAAIFAVVSAILIGAFVIVEWIANEWLSANHTTSAIIGMLVALALGVSIRYVHKFVDRFVDRVLFRQRHEDEAQLRSFAHEAGFITDRTTLLDRAVETIKRATRADASIVTFDDGRANVGENDPAVVALRAWHKPIDLERFASSALRGQFAFPMVARGQLIGALVCGTKQDSEIYAPDEYEALQLLADGVGSALSVLSNEAAGSDGTLNGTIAELRAAIADLRELKTRSGG